MLEKGFNQFMLNSGENQFRSEKHFKPGPGVNADLRKLAQATLQQGGVTIIGNMTFEAEKMSDCYVGMLFSNIKGVKIPLLITCGAKTEEAGKKIWSKFQKYYPEDKSVIAMRHRRPPAPFVTDFMPDNSMPPDMDSFRFFMSGISCDAILKKLAQESLTPEGVEVIENVRLQSKARDGAYCGTVFSPVDGKAIPLLISFGARTEEAGQKIWMDIQNELSNLDTAHIFNVAQMMNHRPCALFVADFLFGFAPNFQAVEFLFSGMSGDFCKCMGWAFLFPGVLAS